MQYAKYLSAVTAILALSSGNASAAPLDRFLQNELVAGRTYYVDAVVRFRADIRPAEEVRLKALGGDVYRHLPLIDALAVRIPRKNLVRLARDPQVASLSADVRVKKSDEFIVSRSGADVAWSDAPGYGVTGVGVGVAVVDSGVDTLQPDFLYSGQFKSRVRTRVNFVTQGESDKDISSLTDLCGHGTHVAGIVAGNGASSSGSRAYRTFKGIAPEAEIVGVRVLNREGQGTVSDSIAGIQWVVENKAAYNIRVLNFSAGHPVGESYKTDPLCQAVEAAWNSGIVVVVAAGNQGRLKSSTSNKRDNEGFGTNWGSIQSPGNDPLAITVGAMKDGGQGRLSDRVATYSSRGPSRYDFVMKPDLVAPGNRVISLNPLFGTSYIAENYGEYSILPWNAYLTTDSSNASRSYYVLSGTSMAAPVVAGAAALMLQKDAKLKPDAVKARLMISADKWVSPTGFGDPLTYGAGYLNIPAALSATGSIPLLPARTPSLVRTASGWVILDPNQLGSSATGRNIIWGTAGFSPNIIWGTAGFAPNIIWGTAGYVLGNSNVIWGTNLWTSLTAYPVGSSNADLSATAIFGEK